MKMWIDTEFNEYQGAHSVLLLVLRQRGARRGDGVPARVRAPRAWTVVRRSAALRASAKAESGGEAALMGSASYQRPLRRTRT